MSVGPSLIHPLPIADSVFIFQQSYVTRKRTTYTSLIDESPELRALNQSTRRFILVISGVVAEGLMDRAGFPVRIGCLCRAISRVALRDLIPPVCRARARGCGAVTS
jgi:hypothetical protein